MSDRETKSIVIDRRSPLAASVVVNACGDISIPFGGGRVMVSKSDFDLLGSTVVGALAERKRVLAADLINDPVRGIGMIRQAQIEKL